MSTLFLALHQQQHISAAKGSAQRAGDRITRIESDINQLQHSVERLSLTCQALWELLRDNTEFTEDHILEKMTEVDLRDGQADGRIGHNVLECPSCHRPSNSQRTQCVYCGTKLERKHLFE